MKTIVKRYRVFLLLLAFNLLVLLLWPDIGRTSLDLSWKNLKEMVAVLPPIFVLLGLLDVWVDRANMIKYTGHGSGIKGILIAFFLGSMAAGPLYAAFPLAGVMLKKGSSLRTVFVFIGAWSTTKITLLTFEATSMGFPFMLTRLVLSIVGILAIAWVTERSLTEAQKQEVYELNSGKEG